MKKLLFTSFFATAFLAVASVASAATPWNTTGSYIFDFELGGTYSHDVTLTQDASGNLTGTGGGYPVGGPYVYTWVLDSGSVTGDTIEFTAHYTAGADAVTPLTVMHVTGTIDSDGTMSGTWTDNYQGGSRAGTWSTDEKASNIGAATNKDQCKNDGWKVFNQPVYKNQGQCVSATVNQSKNR